VSFRGAVTFVGAMAAAWLPLRHWNRLPVTFPMNTAAFVSGIATLFAGMAIGIPGFLEHAHATTSLAIDAQLHEVFRNPDAGYSQGMSQGFAGLSLFTFLLLTPPGWLTLYLTITGAIRAGAAWFDDPVGDPILTGLDAIVSRQRGESAARRAHADREAREGPEIPDRVVSSAAAGIPNCDLVIVASRRKAGWERGVAVFTPDKVYRLGAPVEQTVAGRLRYLYPLTEHADHEAIRRSVQYEIP
jgi:hypothetical protein